MAHVTGNEHLAVDAIAREFHEAGLTAALEGEFTTAHVEFEYALGRLDMLDSTLDTTVQRARIFRDDGFTNVRDALTTSGSDAEEGFEFAQSILEESSGMTIEPAEAALNKLYEGTPLDGREREILSEHGATRACLGRKVIAMQVATGQLSTDQKATQDVIAAQRYFGRQDAHGYLREGSKTYERTSNAMRGALAERANGRPAHVVPWLGRAAVGLAKSVVTSEFGPSLRTVARIGLALRSRRASLNSIVQRP